MWAVGVEVSHNDWQPVGLCTPLAGLHNCVGASGMQVGEQHWQTLL